MTVGTEPSSKNWEAVARECEYATFFHSPLWATLASRAYSDVRVTSRLLSSRDGLTVVLPLVTRPTVRGLTVASLSTFAGCYGGLIANGDLDAEESRSLLAEAVGDVRGAIELTGNPVAPFSTPLSGARTKPVFTDILDLTVGSSAVTSGFSKSRRYEIRRGRSNGAETRIARSLDDYHTYFSLYEGSLHRWGKRTTSRYPMRLFEEAHRMAVEHPENVRLWLADVDGRSVAGMLVFYWNGHAAYWHGAAAQHAFSTFANSVLLADVIEHACSEGFRWFDLGPSGGHKGVADYKRQFGGERRSFPSYVRKPGWLTLVEKVHRLVHR